MSPSNRSPGRTPDDGAALRRLHALAHQQQRSGAGHRQRPEPASEPEPVPETEPEAEPGTEPEPGTSPESLPRSDLVADPAEDPAARDGESVAPYGGEPDTDDLPVIDALPSPPYAVGPPAGADASSASRSRGSRRRSPGEPAAARSRAAGRTASGAQPARRPSQRRERAGAASSAPGDGVPGFPRLEPESPGRRGTHRRDPPSGPPPGYVEVTESPPTFMDRAGTLLAQIAPSTADQPRLGRSGVRALLGVCVIAVLATVWFLVQSRPDPEPAPASRVGGGSASASPPPLGSAPPASPSGDVVVHVGGDVEKPGVVVLPAGSRVSDAVKAAGGLTSDADPGLLNLARPLVDGEQILVGATPSPAPGAPAPGAPPGAAPVPGASPGGAAGAPIDLNTASLDQLDSLPGVGPVLAQRIVDFRTQNGGFRSVDQLQDVTGIGEKRFEELGPLVTVAGAR